MASLFISHSSRDDVIAKEVRDRLKARGFESLFLDFDPEQGIPAGRDWEKELYSQLRTADAVVFLGSLDSLKSQWCFAELALARSVDRPIFPLLLDGESRHPLLADIQWIDLAAEGEAAYERLFAAMDRQGFRPLDSFTPHPTRPPYPGLASFDVDDAAFFFGREGEIDELLARLHPTLERPTGRLIVLIGPSGSGKSSLLRAGIIPRLSRLRGGWVVLPPFVPGDRAIASFAHVVAGAVRELGEDRDAMDFERQIRTNPGNLVDALVRIRDVSLGPSGSMLVSIDQTEELATRTGSQDRRTFVRLLAAALEGIPRLWILATARSDLLGAALQQRDDPDLQLEVVALKPLDRASLARVIEGPASRVGLDFDPGLVSRMVEETRGGDALPLLAYTLQQLWERVDSTKRISLRDYETIGGVDGAVRNRADALMAEFAREGQSELVVSSLLELTDIDASGEPIRRRVPRSEFDPAEDQVVEAFIRARLLHSEATDGGQVVEVAHEALLRAWVPLREAIDDTRDQLRLRSELGRLAKEWDADARQDSYLLRGARLDRFRKLTAAPVRGVELGDLERGFLSASVALAERERRRRRLATLALTLLTIVATVGAVAASGFAIVANRERDAALSRELAAQAESQLSTDPQQSLELALQAADHGENAEVERALRQALIASHTRAIFEGHGGPVNSAAFSPDGRLIVTAGEGQPARIWEAGGQLIRTLGLAEADVVEAVFTPSGALVVTAGTDGSVASWRVDTGALVHSFNPSPSIVTDVAFTRDRALVATAGEDGVARVVTTTGRLQCELKRHNGPLTSVTFNSMGTRVATASQDGTARVWNVSASGCRSGPPIRGGPDRDPLNIVAFSPDGMRLVTGDASGRARIWRVKGGRPMSTLGGHSGGVVTASFSPDGRTVVTASADGIGRLWDPGTGEAKLLVGHTDGLTSAAFSRDGRLLVTAGRDNTARVWSRAGEEVAVLRGHTGTLSSAAFDRTSTRAVTSSADGTARVWEIPRRLSLGPHTQGVRSIASDGTLVVTGDDSGKVRLWNANTGDFVRNLIKLRGAAVRIALSRNGKRLLAASEEGAAHVWEMDSLGAGAVLNGPRETLMDAALSSDGTLAVTAGHGLARVWDIGGLASIPPPKELRGHSGLVESVAIRPGSRRVIATGDDGGTVRLWNPSSPDPQVLGDFDTRVVRVAFSSDGMRLLAVSGDGTARTWDADTAKEIAVTSALGEDVAAAAFSPDGKLVVVAGEDPTLRIVRIDSGGVFATLVGHKRKVVDIEFSADGSRLVTASDDATARVWAVMPGEREGVELLGHQGRLTAAGFVLDRGTVLTASEDRTARVFACGACGSLNDLLRVARSRLRDR